MIPADKVLEPQNILPVGAEQLLPDLRRQRRGWTKTGGQTPRDDDALAQ